MISFTSSTFIFEMLNLLFLFWLFKKYLFKPLTNFMNKRTTKIEDSLKNAQKKLEESDKLKADYEKQLGDIKLKSKEIIESSKVEAKKDFEDIVGQAKEQAEKIVSQAKEQIENDRKKAFEEMKDQIVDISINIATKVINEQIDLIKDEKYIDDLIKEEGLERWPK